jgi:hypothetical protein
MGTLRSSRRFPQLFWRYDHNLLSLFALATTFVLVRCISQLKLLCIFTSTMIRRVHVELLPKVQWEIRYKISW